MQNSTNSTLKEKCFTYLDIEEALSEIDFSNLDFDLDLYADMDLDFFADLFKCSEDNLSKLDKYDTIKKG